MLGPIIISISGTELSVNDQEILSDPAIGGVILFSENFIDKLQLQKLVHSIKNIKDPELLVFVDQEGGRIQRFRNGFFHLPSHRDLGRVYDRKIKDGIRSAELTGYIMAAELISQGVDLSFSPVVDIDHGVSEVISDRAFHSDPFIVGEMAKSYIVGMSNAGMKSVAKHFPGHGAVVADSHKYQPIDSRSMSDIEKDIRPYLELIKTNLTGIMTAHIVFPSIDHTIATFSNKWLSEILRQKYSYGGFIFSDDLTMQSAVDTGPMPQRIHQAIDAGCDFILWCHPDESVHSVLKELDEAMIDKTSSYNELRTSYESVDLEEVEQCIGELNSLLNMK
ncbi:MAG: beta-N-acetylhexosaminidase [Gammaproteobacteria bacterium]|nr:beta-N-acetylhexosaminidase [Gammaproteobacteria bacterium]